MRRTRDPRWEAESEPATPVLHVEKPKPIAPELMREAFTAPIAIERIDRLAMVRFGKPTTNTAADIERWRKCWTDAARILASTPREVLLARGEDGAQLVGQVSAHEMRLHFDRLPETE